MSEAHLYQRHAGLPASSTPPQEALAAENVDLRLLLAQAEINAQGLLAHGAAHVTAGFADNMLPYGDYYFMEALMRSLGHTQFFW